MKTSNSKQDASSLEEQPSKISGQLIQDKSIPKSAKRLIEINKEQLERNTKLSGKKSSAGQVASQERPLPHVMENVRALIKTNSAKCVSEEGAIEQAGFVKNPHQLAKSVYTSFYQAKFAGKSLVLKKLLIGKLVKHNRDQLLNQSVKIMRHLCSPPSDTGNAGNQQHLTTYFIHIYEIFLLVGSGSQGDVMYIFMDELRNRSISNRIKKVAQVKFRYIKRWCYQIIYAITHMQEKAISHRALRPEHLLLDSNENIRITSWTRSVICIDPVTGEAAMQPKEPVAKRKSHLPPEVFLGEYMPANVDFWSLGVTLAFLCTKEFPFNPMKTTIPFQEQWNQFYQTHKKALREDCLSIFHIIFDFSPDSSCSTRQRTEEVHELLNANSLETEQGEGASEDTGELQSSESVDVIEDTVPDPGVPSENDKPPS